MPSTSPRSPRAIADAPNSGGKAYVQRIADGHRSPPRYPDGVEFDLCGDEVDGNSPSKHLSEIRDFRGDFG